VKAPDSAGSWLEIDLEAVKDNVVEIQRHIGERCQVGAVVKADGYGHGAVPVGKAALEGGAGWLIVLSAGEGETLRKAGIKAPIFVLGAGLPSQAEQAVSNDLAHAVCTMEMARALSDAAVRMGKPARVHLKVDTGLGRLGVEPEEAMEFARKIGGLPGIRVEGIFSHLSASDSDPVYSERQFSVFQKVCSQLEAAGMGGLVRHIANSGGTLRYPSMHLDLVRPGLLIYGLAPSGEVPIALRPALAWKARIYFGKKVPAGRRISYAGTYVTRRATNIAVALAGYADGYARALSNRASALVRGRRVPVAGRICMDQFLLDLGDEPAGVGEEVVLIGRQGTEEIRANEVAGWRGTSVYEVVTSVNKRVPRVYFGNGAAGE